MIARIWRGATLAGDADSYLDYLQHTGFAAYRATPGNHATFALRRVVDGRAELLLLTLWDSHEAIQTFAGPDAGRAVFYPEDDRFLVQREEFVEHFDVVFASSGDIPQRSRG
jgi:heme-degrading monooxygenase HmoA